MVLPKQGKKVRVDQRLLDLSRKKNASLLYIYIYIYKSDIVLEFIKKIKKEQ